MTMFDVIMEAWGALMVMLVLLWLAPNVAAEFVHAWKAKTARSLMNVYTLSFGLSLVGLF